MGGGMQQYCLRWNNHRSNLLLVFEHLFHTEAFTDVTLAAEGESIKCHKMVLAACSSYFQHLFMENDCRHPIVILKDIHFYEIKAILEYMYKGEVNVAQDQLAGLLKAAETLKVKGLVEDSQRVTSTPSPTRHNESPSCYNSQPHSNQDYHPHPSSVPPSFSKSNLTNSHPLKFPPPPTESMYDNAYNTVSAPNSSSSAIPERNALPFPIWAANKLCLSPSPQHANNCPTTTHSAINSICHSFENSSQVEPVPLKKKKFMNVTKDTPILRTVLGHTSLQMNSEPQHKSLNYSMTPSTSNGPIDCNDKGRVDSPDQFKDDTIRSVDSDKVYEDNHSFNLDSEDKHGLATYVPTQKPEWKRYKQYTRNDIMAAIDAVRAGMSALQAARKYGVPSRTLYDKVKKLGITTNRPYRKGSFPMSPYQGMNQKLDDNSGYSPEELGMDISNNGAGNGNHHNSTLNGLEGDFDKMDSDPGSSIKQERSPPLDDDKDDSNHGIEDLVENGSRNCSSTSPRDRDPSENEERSGSD